MIFGGAAEHQISFEIPLPQNGCNNAGLKFCSVCTKRRAACRRHVRLGTIEEFGKAGASLLSPAADYIMGTSLVVDGGKMRTL